MPQEQIAQTLPQILERGGAGVAAASGAVALVADYSSLITVGFGFIGCSCAVAGLVWQIRRDRDRLRREREMHTAQMAELMKRFRQ